MKKLLYLYLLLLSIMSCQKTTVFHYEISGINLCVKVASKDELPTRFTGILHVSGSNITAVDKEVVFVRASLVDSTIFSTSSPIELPESFFGNTINLSLNAMIDGVSWVSSTETAVIVMDNLSAINLVLYPASGMPHCANPQFSSPGGTYSLPLSIALSCSTENSVIRYTLNGTIPDNTSAIYTGTIIIQTNTTITAIAQKALWLDSEVVTANYFPINVPQQMVLVSGGTFNNSTSNITIADFYISNFEVTQAEYQAIMNFNPAHFTGSTENPVEQASWFDAVEYCNRRSIIEGLAPCYTYSTFGTDPANWPLGWNSDNLNHTNISCNWTAVGYRLPTEMEWIYAARGGNQSDNYTYSGSNEVEPVAWYSLNSALTTHTVGSKVSNQIGLYDMSGNVWEWCWDIFDVYTSQDQSNPHGADTGDQRVLRGGAWNLGANECTLTYRNSTLPAYGYNYGGFRICRILQ